MAKAVSIGCVRLASAGSTVQMVETSEVRGGSEHRSVITLAAATAAAAGQRM